ncbi:MAG: helix-turn-helix transcriptional regulator [Cyclobacteriaceae bacterium]
MRNIVAERLKAFRIQVGLSVADFAKIVGKGTPAIYAIEQGRVFPQVDDLATLQQLYGLNLNWIVSGNGNMILNENKSDFNGGNLKELINTLRSDPDNDDLADEIEGQIDVILKNQEKLKRVFKLLEEVKKDN